MKKIILILPVLILFTIGCSDELSSVQKKSFIKFYGSYQTDQGKDVQVLPDGGFALCGTINPDSVTKMALLFTDEYGNQEEGSPHYYGENYRTVGNTLLRLQDGFLLGGYLEDTLSDGKLQTDGFLVRTDLSGDTLWTRRYGGNGDDYISHAIKRSEGGFVLAGKYMTNGQDDIWIFMVDEDGTLMYSLKGNNLSEDDEANYLLPAGTGYLCACTYVDDALDGSDFYIVYVDSYCNIITTRAMGTGYDDYARQILSFGDSYLLMGYTENTLTTHNQIALYTFQVEGNNIQNVQSLATFSESASDQTGEGCTITDEGNIAVVGTREVNENKDMLLLIINRDGSLLSNEDGEVTGIIKMGGTGNQTGSRIRVTPDGGLVMIGTNALEGNADISLVKTSARGEF